MDPSGAAPPNPAPAPQPRQQSQLIRTDQVAKLPHLTDEQKQRHKQVVKTLWNTLNNNLPNTPHYQQAQAQLSQLSQDLMKGMQAHLQAQRQNQSRAAQASQLAQQNGPLAPNQVQSSIPNPQIFQQLQPQIQHKVNGFKFVLPPQIPKEQSGDYIQEAKTRFGQALQRQELGRQKLKELTQMYAQRQAAGNPLAPEEQQQFQGRKIAYDKAIKESGEFLARFKQQQDEFRKQHEDLQLSNRPGSQNFPGQPQPGQNDPSSMGNDQMSVDGGRPSIQPNQVPPSQGPAPHTINSAMVAARNQASAAQAAVNSSTTSQPGQVPLSQPQSAVSTGTPTTQHPMNPTLNGPPQPQQPQQNPQMEGAASSQAAAGQQTNPQGPPRPLSHEVAMARAAQANQQQSAPQSATAHSHPQGYVGNRTGENSSRNINMTISKNLNVPPPQPVSMGPARPTLSGGPGAMGQMGTPAIPKHPGFVLESDGGRILSKKKLDELVRQVTGGGDNDGLTPDAEEVILQMADDFVDDVVTSACKLAKLRASSTLDIRDIQLILERNYNIRIPGYASDEIRTVKKFHPAQGWTQKMSAVQAAKVTGGSKSDL